MTNLNYDKIPRPELKFLADAEADELVIPDTIWERPRRQALAIDDDSAYCREDAISYSVSEEGKYIIHVSIVDAGSLSTELPALTALIDRHLHLDVMRTKTETTLVPRILKTKLGFVNDDYRPAVTVHLTLGDEGHIDDVTIEQELVKASEITPSNLDSISDADKLSVASLHRIVKVLALKQSSNIPYSLFSDTTELSPNGMYFIVNRCMQAANSALSHYFNAHNIPRIYRTYSLSTLLPGQSKTGAKNLTKRYSTSDTTGILSATSPLRRIDDFVHNRNLADHLRQETPFYTASALGQFAMKLNRSDSLLSKAKQTIKDLQLSLTRHTLTPSDFCDIFFETSFNGIRGMAALKRDALRSMIDTDDALPATLALAIEKGLVTIVESEQGAMLTINEQEIVPFNAAMLHPPASTDSLVAMSFLTDNPLSHAEANRLLQNAKVISTNQQEIVKLRKEIPRLRPWSA